MRLDKYLKVSRLIKRRTVANEACDNGLVTVNGKPARASYEVKAGDQISLRFGVRTVTVEVLSVQETVRQADAAALYQTARVFAAPSSYSFKIRRRGRHFLRLHFFPFASRSHDLAAATFKVST